MSIFSTETQNAANNHQDHESNSKRLFSVNLMSHFGNLALFDPNSCKMSIFSTETQNAANNHQDRESSSKQLFTFNLSDFGNLAPFEHNSCKMSIPCPNHCGILQG